MSHLTESIWAENHGGPALQMWPIHGSARVAFEEEGNDVGVRHNKQSVRSDLG